MFTTFTLFSTTKGFSVGDELGFPESLGNVEGSKRRALNLRTGANSLGVLPGAKMPVRKSNFHFHLSKLCEFLPVITDSRLSIPQSELSTHEIFEITSKLNNNFR